MAAFRALGDSLFSFMPILFSVGGLLGSLPHGRPCVFSGAALSATKPRKHDIGVLLADKADRIHMGWAKIADAVTTPITKLTVDIALN